jgi:hypothetical protein
MVYCTLYLIGAFPSFGGLLAGESHRKGVEFILVMSQTVVMVVQGTGN